MMNPKYSFRFLGGREQKKAKPKGALKTALLIGSAALALRASRVHAQNLEPPTYTQQLPNGTWESSQPGNFNDPPVYAQPLQNGGYETYQLPGAYSGDDDN
jgi:hypothetical protein